MNSTNSYKLKRVYVTTGKGKAAEIDRMLIRCCNEHGTIYAISSDFGDRMTTQSMRLTSLLSRSF